ncbi:hypothetical protein Cob_v011885 [Colletotrichum orbiculare MAFF 240422]|uniref:Uncharacterized protein n=1 Tax=Colletotrichum orbiculare (strain 104-T / ATCC 96160 / CBS 514.97 / LARS 414 / MAFF 240422) TaxID=1213857 RepID=N4V704_COLOR|nr:hypothetical protein Cob_v011885 [Colletotrichum orbiculare MAFF 240422]
MKSSILSTTFFLTAASAVELICWGAGVPSPISKGDIEWAIKNRATDLGIPGATKFTYTWKTCIDPENSPKSVAVINTPRITKEGYAKLANGEVQCSTSGPPDSTC